MVGITYLISDYITEDFKLKEVYTTVGIVIEISRGVQIRNISLEKVWKCKNHWEATTMILTSYFYDSRSQLKSVLVIVDVYRTSRVILRRLTGIHGKPHQLMISGESPEAKGISHRLPQLSTYSYCQNNDFSFSPTFKSSIPDSILEPHKERDSAKCRSILLLQM